ncbi:hypothetical protein HBH98_184820 [Parastagonospora nodorum]|nr:hypothetical protein HBH52_024780 [Parastagonospora nodorum]KAH4205082.1 hypothetical protein HBI95_143560 [Parastagonospora nodorum]KAH4309998.1 hypothetical protein HBI01_025000 [Parastagonospora nodorum]KAH4315581.1 hypothetical protein HBI02_055260 [Parastagonospora nodorum]KAH4338260.1 hypothetical protein HBI00_001890 [Parastagonospora nodorum]
MARTFEVGRAVLTSTTHNLELWLSTLITLSPSQDSIDVEQPSFHSLTRILSSSDIWVGRGNGMRIELALTHRGEPLPKLNLQMLREMIIQAPIWPQLKLKPTVPCDDMLQDGIAHVAISYADDDSSTNERQRHRILNKVPAAAVRPPEGVSSLQLQVVRFTMDLLESRQRPQMKRANTMLEETSTQIQSCDDNKNEDADTLLHETIESPGPAMKGTTRKRKRPGRQAPSRTCSTPVSLFDNEAKSNKRAATITNPRVPDQDVITEQLMEIRSMVEGAMRLSIYGNSKLPAGIKVKANTFGIGLADVAPILWRPGHLAALSQRAHLAPTVCRSLGHAIGVKATSTSLSEKFKELIGTRSRNSLHSRLGQGTAVDGQLQSMASSLSDQLWLHLQRSLLARPAPSLQPFTTCDADAADAHVSDEILVPVDLLCEAGAAPSTIEERELSSTISDDTKEEVWPPTPSGVRPGLLQGYETAVQREEYPIAFEDDLLLDAMPADAGSDYRDADRQVVNFGASAPTRSPNYATLERQITERLPAIPHKQR